MFTIAPLRFLIMWGSAYFAIDLDRRAARATHPDIVDEHVEPAPPRDDIADRSLASLRVRDVAGKNDRRSALALDHRVRAFGGRALEVEKRDMHTLAREQNRCGAAVADAIAQRARAGDDRDAPLQSHLGHFCSPWLGAG